MTDTPPAAPTFPPATKAEQLKGFLGDLARPFVLIVTASACAAGTLLAGVTSDKLTVAFGALTLMFGAKAAEVTVTAQANAKAATAQANAGAGQGQ